MRGLAIAAALLCACGACFPTFQSARVEPGFRVDAGVIALADQPRNGASQRPDYIATITPAYGFGRRFELGLPIGAYAADGLQTRSKLLLVLPYAKVALLDPAWRDHLSLTGQAAFFLPANVSLDYGRDLGAWEPQVGVSYILSAGPAGDDPIVTRYQQQAQSLVAWTVGATFNSPRRPALEVGVLSNSYDRCVPYSWCSASQPRTRVKLYDLFVGARVGVVK
jgi:hypothetical protein